MIVGNLGVEDKKMDYTVIGDLVNLAARVGTLNKKFNSHILITELTLESVRNLVGSGKLGHLATRGMERVVVK